MNVTDNTRRLGKRRKGQMSMEYLLIMSFSFLLIIPLVIVFYTQSVGMKDRITNAQADRVVSKITEAASTVYYLGDDTKRTIKVNMPDNVKSVTVNNNYVSLLLDVSSGDTEVVDWSAGNLSGSINPRKGVHVITLTVNDSVVHIQDG